MLDIAGALVTLTACVIVVFSILVPGLRLGALVRRTIGAPTQVPLPEAP